MTVALRRAFASCCLIVLVSACSEKGERGSDTQPDAAGSAAHAVGGAGAAGATPSAGAGGTTMAPGVVDAGSGGVGGGAEPAGAGGQDASAAAEVTAHTLYPLVLGRSWTFEVTATGDNPTCVVGVRTAQVLESTEPTDPASVLLTGYCDDDPPRGTRAVEAGIEQRTGDAWGLTLGNPVEEGSTWLYFNQMHFAWHRVGTVTVRAGTFDECWERVAVDSGIYTTTYCHQVGPVRAIDDSFVAELTAFATP